MLCILHLVMVCRYKNQNVAVKVMHKGDTPEEVAKKEARFMREVAMLARVQHKNLVKVRLHWWRPSPSIFLRFR